MTEVATRGAPRPLLVSDRPGRGHAHESKSPDGTVRRAGLPERLPGLDRSPRLLDRDEWRITGRNDRGIPQLGIAPNGRTLDVVAITVDSLIDGIPRRFSMVDLSRVIDQIGDDVERAAS
jgi:hypothetical protein